MNNKDIFVEFPLYNGARISIRLYAITGFQEIKYSNGKSDCLIYFGADDPATVPLPYEEVIERTRCCIDAANRL